MKNTEEKFWSNVDTGGEGCWEWRGDLCSNNYGRFYFCGKRELAHRLSWRFQFGVIPPGMFVLHHCDNPRCIRPSHLFLGNNSDNMQDAVRKGRHYSHGRTLTQCRNGHPYDEENTYKKNGQRNCRKCNLKAVLRYKARHATR